MPEDKDIGTITSFPAALRHYLTTGTHGQPTPLDEMKCLILDKENRNSYENELRGYGYGVKPTA